MREGGHVRVGLGLALVAILWTALCAALHGGTPWPMIGLICGAMVAFLVGRSLARYAVLVAGVITVAIGVTILATVEMVNLDLPLRVGKIDAGPFGYSNANAQLAVQGAAAAAMVLVLARRRAVRIAAGVWGAGLALAPLATASWGGVAAAVVLVAASAGAILVGVEGRWRTAYLVAPLGLIVAVVLMTVTLGVGHLQGGTTPHLAATTLTHRRIDLWSDAVQITTQHPVSGIGPGRFGEVSRTAMANPDTSEAHSMWLEAAAELGVPGAVLIAALWCWGMSRLGRQGAPGLVAVGSSTALLVQAGIDYVADFWPIVITVALLLGLAARSSLPTRTVRRLRG